MRSNSVQHRCGESRHNAAFGQNPVCIAPVSALDADTGGEILAAWFAPHV
jgi:hypothetical protein